MNQKLTVQNTVGMGFMMFAMFLGAGNLIFPPMVGQLAGQEMWPAALGFLLTGVGLPLLGIVAIARVGGGFNEISKEIPKAFVVTLGVSIYLIIGPLYAVPRTALVAYEVGFVPSLNVSGKLVQFIFSSFFFGISWYLSISPGNLLESVGKLITPALVVLLVVLGLSPVFNPLGTPGDAVNVYAQTPFIKGFLEGYLTMDALAALMFGIIIITNLKSHGIKDKSSLFKYSVITGFIAAFGLGLVYLSLFYLGATSRDLLPNPSNGGQILTTYVETLFGTTGTFLLAGIVTLACLTTSVGCITATSKYFDGLLTKVSYRTIVTVVSLVCVMFANMGLNEIIEFFLPVLLVLYPISISLIFLSLIRDWLPNTQLTYRVTLTVTFLLSLVDLFRTEDFLVLGVFGDVFKMVPGYENHMAWLLPSLVTLLLTMIVGFFTRKRISGH